MDDEYNEITSELDAREILRYLNNLGIHNVSGEVLKYFITDLKRLIKYDLQNRYKHLDKHEEYEIQWSERLHSASTFSSRIKSKVHDGAVICNRECQKTWANKPHKVQNTHSAPNLGLTKVDDKPLRRACSCIRVEKKPEMVKEKLAVNSNSLIKVSRPPIMKKCDPVTLYHYYTSLWAKYKPNVPGENNWSELRWSVRQKMAGNEPKHIVNKISNTQSQKDIGQTKN